ncbi:hypothetical protein FS837_006981 [Tulasnella sp. UAMH 9824]|nr:hypothetical protein FS837_006981 [Tulasnella sp. UAMH 9824]
MQEFSSSLGDDGLPTRSSILPNFIHLSQIGDFWKRYDALAESHDTKMYKQINGLLDVLLIFAGLFSAINTAFISLTMPALSPSPSAETNMLLRLLVAKADNSSLSPSAIAQPFTPEPISVAMNGFLFASLSCSLYGALIIMFLKESLSTLDGAKQPGPIENQGRFRQRKLDGVRTWHLATCISLLPYVISVSLALFAIGVEMWLFTVNATVGAIVGATVVVETVLALAVIIAGAIHPQCPYATAGSRTLRACWMGVWQTILAAGRTEVVRIFRSLLRRYMRSGGSVRRTSSPTPDEGMLPFRDPSQPPITIPVDTLDSIHVEGEPGDTKAEHKRQVTNARAAFWLLEVAPSREDQVLAVQFLSTTSREAYGAFTVSPQQRRLMISSTLEAFDIWQTQPNERTQEVAEHFGRALCRMLPKTRGSSEQWEELSALTRGPRLGFGAQLLRALDASVNVEKRAGAVSEEYTLQFALLQTLVVTRDIPTEAYRWTKLKYLIRNEDENSQLLGLWAILMYKGFGHAESYPLRQSFRRSIVKQRHSLKRSVMCIQIDLLVQNTDINYERVVTYNDYPLALACAVRALKSVEGQAAPDNAASLLSDAVEIYHACIHKTMELAKDDHLLPASQELVADGLTDMMAYFAQSAFVNPIGKSMINFFTSALRLLQSVRHSGDKPSLGAAAFRGLWYTLDSLILALDASAEIDRRSVEEVVLKTLESIGDWLPVKSGASSPMFGLENHPRIIEHIISRLVDELQTSEGRVVHLTYENRFRWFTEASDALRVAWTDAGLSSQLVDALGRPDAWKTKSLLVGMLEDITEMSLDWCCRLVADGFLVSVANAILHFDKVENGNPVRRRSIQCQLTRSLLSVWRHCSTIPEIKWPLERMRLVIESANSATEWLLGCDATKIGPQAQASLNTTFDNDTILDIRNRLELFFDWTNEYLSRSAPLKGEGYTTQIVSSPLIHPMDRRSPPASRFQVSQTCSREIHVENSLL